ncbi:unnamed protein product [Sphagnum troendelagicum]
MATESQTSLQHLQPEALLEDCPNACRPARSNRVEYCACKELSSYWTTSSRVLEDKLTRSTSFDFGLSKKYCGPTTYQHIMCTGSLLGHVLWAIHDQCTDYLQ